MAYGLPARGQRDWDDELNNSVEALKAKAEAAEADAAAARSTANYARDQLDALKANGAVYLAEDPSDVGTFIIAKT